MGNKKWLSKPNMQKYKTKYLHISPISNCIFFFIKFHDSRNIHLFLYNLYSGETLSFYFLLFRLHIIQKLLSEFLL